MKPLFITGIGTDIGKTIVSAVLVEKLDADYWKPVQSGELENSDTRKVRNLVTNSISVFYDEAYKLTQPYSPHKSAALDGIEIDINNIIMPSGSNTLIIEGAGGLMVPLNSSHHVIDLIQKFKAEVILVVKHYLGSINHTLLSIEILKNKNIPVKGIIYNGEDSYSEEAIVNYCGLPVLGRLPYLSNITSVEIKNLGNQIHIDI
jgi:dethiobiotin synthetase